MKLLLLQVVSPLIPKLKATELESQTGIEGIAKGKERILLIELPRLLQVQHLDFWVKPKLKPKRSGMC